ncbi:argininosuccinate lyase [Fusarium oxysporum f. sp. phaseoli]
MAGIHQRFHSDNTATTYPEFGFVTIADAYSTGSSLMPQKKNLDDLELLRGKAGRTFGHLAGVYCATKGLPSTYNKDSQESWEPMLDHVKTVSDNVQIANGILSTLKLRPERMIASLNPFLLATDVADALVKIVVPSEELGIPMDQLSLEQLQAIDRRFPDNIKDVFNYEASVKSRNAQGGTSRAGVLEQIEVLKGMLN